MAAQPPGYPYPPQPYQVVADLRPTSTAGVVSLVMGCLGFMTFGLTGIVAVILGHMSLKETKSNQVKGHGVAVAGTVLGYLTAVPAVGSVLVLLILLIIGAAAGPPPAG